jgi:hypothetical protein
VRDTDALRRELVRQLGDLWVIDAHEHLADEAERLSATVDASSAFGWYPKWPVQAAGMTPAEYSTWQNLALPLDERWAVFSRYLPMIRTTTFVRSVLLGIRELYGFEDVTDANYREVSRAMQAANSPGIYRRVFRDRARIAAALSQAFTEPLPAPGSFRIPQRWFDFFSAAAGPDRLTRMESALGRPIRSLKAYIEAVPELMARSKGQGVVGIKMGHRPIP